MDKPKKNLIEAYRELCLKAGASIEVGADHYRWFVRLSDEDFSEMVRLVALNSKKDVERWFGATPQMKVHQDVEDHIETILRLIALGYAGIQLDQTLGCYAPIGPDPTDEEDEMIDYKIRSSRPLFRPAVLRSLNLDLDGSSTAR